MDVFHYQDFYSTFLQYTGQKCHFNFRNVNLPVLPAGLQIMADQGFDHCNPIIVLPRANQPQVSQIMRRSVFWYAW